MRIGILTTAAAPGLDTLLARSPQRELFDISCIIMSEKSARSETPALVVRPIKDLPSYKNLRGREEYDRENAELLHSLDTDYVFLLGYPYLLTEQVLDGFPQRVIAFHDGDLLQRDAAGERRWTGLHAVRDAILAGEAATRNSVFITTNEVAQGPLFLQGPRYGVAALARDAVACGDYETVRQYAILHRRWMRRAWGQLALQAIEHLALGDVKAAGDTVWIDGVPGPCRHGDAPEICYELGDAIQRDVPASCPFIRQRG